MEKKLTELVERLTNAAAGNLSAVVLYGSATTGEFHSKHSDLNVLCVVERASAGDLSELHSTAEWWIRQGNPPPLIFTLDELQRSADVFAIELLDIKQAHRMLFGTDFLENLQVPMRLHRLQVERELRIGWLRLREAILVSPRRKKARLGIMLTTISGFCALFRHALFALEQPVPANKREAVDAMASLTGADPSAFRSILDLREGKRKTREIGSEAALQTYLEFVEVVANEVDRRLDMG